MPGDSEKTGGSNDALTPHVAFASMPVVRVERTLWIRCLNARMPIPELALL